MKLTAKLSGAKLLTQLRKSRFIKSVWFFPTLLTLILVLMTILRISGSSIGIYHTLFYGTTKDENLLLNKPLQIRSDEWVMNSQMALGQKNNNFETVNTNIGNGQDMSLIGDAPFRDWASIFKPHNLAFLILPFENAFAFKWWFTAYLLILSCYFFVLAVLPGRKLLAALLGLGLFFSPFIQWWYLPGTMAPIYYGLFGATIFLKMMGQKRLRRSALWGILLAYIAACFALVLYPPFQIPCALAMLVFVIGYVIEIATRNGWHNVLKRLGIVLAAVVIAGLITLTFLQTKTSVIDTIKNTAYPGERIQKSGGYDAVHLVSSHLGAQHQSTSKAPLYSIPVAGLTNQSENSNFILIFPFLLFPSLYLVYVNRRKNNKVDWPLLTVTMTIVVLLAWMLVPHIDILGKITLLSVVPHQRLLIGLGLLNLLQLILFIRHYKMPTQRLFSIRIVLAYSVAILVFEILIGLIAMNRFPGFIDIFRVIAYALPIPLIIYTLLRRRFELAVFGLLLFGLIMTFKVNPLYRGVDTLTKTPISIAIQEISSKDDSRWAVEYSPLENFVIMNGGRSLSGVYIYPQLELWQGADNRDISSVYNRFAHTNFNFDRDPAVSIPTQLKLNGEDNFGIITEPCGAFLRERNVHFLLTPAELDARDTCASLVKKVTYPTITLYIYKI